MALYKESDPTREKAELPALADADEISGTIRAAARIGFSVEITALDGLNGLLILADKLHIVLRRHEHGLVGREIERSNIYPSAGILHCRPFSQEGIDRLLGLRLRLPPGPDSLHVN